MNHSEVTPGFCDTRNVSDLAELALGFMQVFRRFVEFALCERHLAEPLERMGSHHFELRT